MGMGEPDPTEPPVPGGQQDLPITIHSHGTDVLLLLTGLQDGVPLAQVPHLQRPAVVARGKDVVIDGQHAVEGRAAETPAPHRHSHGSRHGPTAPTASKMILQPLPVRPGAAWPQQGRDGDTALAVAAQDEPPVQTYLWALGKRVSSRPSSTVRMWMDLSLDTVKSSGEPCQHPQPRHSPLRPGATPHPRTYSARPGRRPHPGTT